MSQLGWLVNGRRYTHEEAMAYAATYPDDLPYTSAMLSLMWQGARSDGSRHNLRTYLSPTMLSGCVRAEVLKRLPEGALSEYGLESGYWLEPEKVYAMLRGTIGHLLGEQGQHEPDSIIEQQLSCNLTLPDGRIIIIKGTPDKIVPRHDKLDEWLILDYKTVKSFEAQPKKYWINQLSCYSWMLFQHGKNVTRARIIQVGMPAVKQLTLPLLSLEDTHTYLVQRALRFISFLDPALSWQERIEIPLDPVLDGRDSTWQCHRLPRDKGGAWCPVSNLCWTLNRLGI